MTDDSKIQEREVKDKVAEKWFSSYDTTKGIGNIDFCVATKEELFEPVYFLWAELKRGRSDINESLVQLILTIGRGRMLESSLPPLFLGAFDSKRIAFVPYEKIMDVFDMNDFNWNVRPSDHKTKEFELLAEMVGACLKRETMLFDFDEEGEDLRKFIRKNFVDGDGSVSKIQISRHNYKNIYHKWLSEVRQTIAIDREAVKEMTLLDADFYLADILSKNNSMVMQGLSVSLEGDHYVLNRGDIKGLISYSNVWFNDGQEAHTSFWNRYERPPKEEYWGEIVDRRDLLVSPDVRERKGSFYTPQKWVELSQEYLAWELGKDWQNEYYVWDCCAGTGNLLAGLTNKYKVWASTLDQPDVNNTKQLAKMGTLNLLEAHIFQFDFLNDDFGKVPESLRKIIEDPTERKKLIIYINPPYVEATNARAIASGKNRPGVARGNKVEEKYREELGKAVNELFAQFLMRIYKEIPGCVLADFSKLKILQGGNFDCFRNNFQAELRRCFVVPANTFDNVKGNFPIGFFIWDTSKGGTFKTITADVYDRSGNHICQKRLYSPDGKPNINKWITTFDKGGEIIGLTVSSAPDFQHNKQIAILSRRQKRYCFKITTENIIPHCVYFSVRHCVKANWLNDRDQFLTPDFGWKEDFEFQHDCLAYALFHGQNLITSKVDGVNHWIPFPEGEVGARDCFRSHFMSDFIAGRRTTTGDGSTGDLFGGKPVPIMFSPEAKAVMDAGRELWRYYHSQPKATPNASHYDIRLHFQGTNDKGKMNPKSGDTNYMKILGSLKARIDDLARKIEPKVYEYGFLLK